MKKLTPKIKVAAIVPAFNEEATIAGVVKVLLRSKYLDEVIVVDDGSFDDTGLVAKRLGAKLVRLPKNKGKGGAIKAGMQATDAPVLLLVDADLIGFSKKHIFSLLKPLLRQEAVMSVGIRERTFGLPKFLVAIDPLGGQRAVERFLLDSIPEKFTQGFAIEIALNYYCALKKLPVVYIDIKNLKQKIKERKWGLQKGLRSRLNMICQILSVRLMLIFSKNEFK